MKRNDAVVNPLPLAWRTSSSSRGIHGVQTGGGAAPNRSWLALSTTSQLDIRGKLDVKIDPCTVVVRRCSAKISFLDATGASVRDANIDCVLFGIPPSAMFDGVELHDDSILRGLVIYGCCAVADDTGTLLRFWRCVSHSRCDYVAMFDEERVC